MFFNCCPEHGADMTPFQVHVLRLLHRIEDRQMANQAELDAFAASLSAVAVELGNVTNGLGTVDSEVQALIQAQANGETLDFTAAQNALAEVQKSADDLKSSADKLSSDAAPVINTPDPAPVDDGSAPVETPPSDSAPVETPAQ